jgi:N-acetylglucosaminyldiphosphoundecaprenol N-acetyl-beta-D-mannosaminyltransferase
MIFSKILGISFHAMDEDEAISLLLSCLDKSRNHIVVTPNPEAVMRARKEPAFAEAVNGADYRFPDGTGIVLASRLTKSPIRSRLRGYDTTVKLFETLSRLNRPASVYILGGAPGVPEAAGGNIEKLYPPVKIAGCHHGYFSKNEEEVITDEIKRLKLDILIIGMGMPQQELLAHKHRDLPVRLTLCLGGSIDIMAGKVELAPESFRRLGLEWLHRLIKEPKRAKRMLALPKFALLVLWRFLWPFSSIDK